MASHHDLEDRLDHLLESTEDIRAQIRDENNKRTLWNTNNEKRMRTNRWTARIATLVAVIGILVGGIGVNSAHDARNAARKTDQLLAVSRVASCNAYNDTQDREATAQKGLIRVVVNALTQGEKKTPKLELQIKEFYVTYDKKVDAEYAHHDCSPAGIADFFHLPAPSTTTTTK